MNYSDIKRHLKPYSILRSRKTTINHAFASAIAPCDAYDDQAVRNAVISLGQNPDQALSCVYCDGAADTWDHVFATVKNSGFSGAGHRLGNLLPCCKPCNSRKGNRAWKEFLSLRKEPEPMRVAREARISAYLEKLHVLDELPVVTPEYTRLLEIKNEILRLMAEADKLADAIRSATSPRPRVGEGAAE